MDTAHRCAAPCVKNAPYQMRGKIPFDSHTICSIIYRIVTDNEIKLFNGDIV